MFDVYNSSGFDLYQPFPDIDQWVIDTKYGHSLHGNLKEVIEFMTDKLGFQMDDIEEGLSFLIDSIDSGDNGIHFGMYKTFLFIFKKEIDYERSAS